MNNKAFSQLRKSGITMSEALIIQMRPSFQVSCKTGDIGKPVTYLAGARCACPFPSNILFRQAVSKDSCQTETTNSRWYSLYASNAILASAAMARTCPNPH